MHIFKLSQGEFVVPDKVESAYQNMDLFSQIFVHGDRTSSCLLAVVVGSSTVPVHVLTIHALLDVHQSLRGFDLWAAKAVGNQLSMGGRCTFACEGVWSDEALSKWFPDWTIDIFAGSFPTVTTHTGQSRGFAWGSACFAESGNFTPRKCTLLLSWSVQIQTRMGM